MQRLSLAELKAKANVLTNTEFIIGGSESGCHPEDSCEGSDTFRVGQDEDGNTVVRRITEVVQPLPTLQPKPIQ